ncbi:hypothetical protein DEU56DRAFT_952550 [Suillus clintonianus]|uniref:uncharacterized protein n=1 Tax=Suillus clintonianus TaxID=1904413 RepID=UPI001B87A41E|nr:uncharacterized protein DEU56DRAFT_952550 [Suillus clintonianus]KAG2132338.1 hypothetical protein DEU56DRAFT_952550 [Suillus clintonianus]
MDYVAQLREGILEGYTGVVTGFQNTEKGPTPIVRRVSLCLNSLPRADRNPFSFHFLDLADCADAEGARCCPWAVFMSHAAFQSLDDHIRASDVEEQKRNRMRDAEAEAGLDFCGFGDPYAPYSSPGEESSFVSAFLDPALPLVSNASPFQCADMYDEDYEGLDNRSLHELP